MIRVLTLFSELCILIVILFLENRFIWCRYRPHKKRRAFILVCVSALIAGLVAKIGPGPSRTITITALNEKNADSAEVTVYLERIQLDQKDLGLPQPKMGKWTEFSQRYCWFGPTDNRRTTGQTDSISFQVKAGDKTELVFFENRWKGKVSIQIDDWNNVIDTYWNGENKSRSTAITLPAPSTIMSIQAVLAAVLWFTVSVALLNTIVIFFLKYDKRILIALSKVNPWLILTVIFLIGTIFWGIFASNVGRRTITDEVLHIRLAQSIAHGRGLIVRGGVVDYKECLYSLVISPAFIFAKDTATAHLIIAWINAVLMSSAVFPIYVIARKFLTKQAHIWLVVVYGISIGEMGYVFSAMQENLNYPLMMWFFAAFSHIVLEKRTNLLSMSALGAFAFLLSVSKQMNLAIVIAVALFLLTQFIFKEHTWKKFRETIAFLAIFLALKMIYNAVISFFLIGESSGVGVLSALDSLEMKTILQLIYPVILHAIFTLLATGIFPLPILLGNWKSASKKSESMLSFIILYIIISICAICILTVPNEHLGSMSIRVHLRYFFYSFIIIEMLFLRCYEEFRFKLKYTSTVFIFSLILVCLPFLNLTITQGSFCEGVSTDYLQVLAGNDVLDAARKCILALVFLGGIYFLTQKKARILYSATAAILVISSLLGIRAYTNGVTERWNSRSGNISVEDALILNEFFEDCNVNENGEDILLLQHSVGHELALNCYLDKEYRCIQSVKYEQLDVGEEIDFSGMSLINYSQQWFDLKMLPPRYIISRLKINLQGYQEIGIGLQKYHLYCWTGEQVIKLEA